MTEIAVVGASASGLLTALSLARAGQDVTVYERADQLDPEPRTLIATSRLRKYLGGLGETAFVNEIRRFELYANGKVGTVTLGEPDLIVERSAIIRELAKEANEAGAKINWGMSLLGLHPSNSGMRLDFEGSETVDVKIVVGADGASSAVARLAGWPKQPTVPLVQAIVKLPQDLPPDTSPVWFRPQDTPYFYWLIPESESRGALGVIGEQAGQTRARLDRFLEEKDLAPIEYQAARIPRYTKWTRVHQRIGNGHVYLVGDAAGQVKVSTVGGLVTGFRGAIGVVENILHGRSRHLRSLRLELESHRLIRKVMHSFSEDEYCRLIDLLNDRTAHSLRRHSRDEAPSMLLKIALAQPRFLSLTARKLLSANS
jgi:flavin-dependent dehydrogenase